jgi:hypothetical protein
MTKPREQEQYEAENGGVQKLLLDGIGLTLTDMRRLARWHGQVINPALANASASRMVAQRIAIKKAAKRREDQKAKAAPDEVPFPAPLQTCFKSFRHPRCSAHVLGHIVRQHLEACPCKWPLYHLVSSLQKHHSVH